MSVAIDNFGKKISQGDYSVRISTESGYEEHKFSVQSLSPNYLNTVDIKYFFPNEL